MSAFVLKCIAVHAVDGEHADAPFFDVRAEGADHALTFHFPFVPAAGRESENGPTVIAIDGDAHLAIETGGVPTLMVTIHGCEDNALRGGLKLPFKSATRTAATRVVVQSSTSFTAF